MRGDQSLSEVGEGSLLIEAHVAERSKAADSRSAGGNPARVQISSCAFFLLNAYYLL